MNLTTWRLFPSADDALKPEIGVSPTPHVVAYGKGLKPDFEIHLRLDG